MIYVLHTSIHTSVNWNIGRPPELIHFHSFHLVWLCAWHRPTYRDLWIFPFMVAALLLVGRLAALAGIMTVVLNFLTKTLRQFSRYIRNLTCLRNTLRGKMGGACWVPAFYTWKVHLVRFDRDLLLLLQDLIHPLVHQGSVNHWWLDHVLRPKNYATTYLFILFISWIPKPRHWPCILKKYHRQPPNLLYSLLQLHCFRGYKDFNRCSTLRIPQLPTKNF